MEYISRYYETIVQNDISKWFCLVIVFLLAVATVLVMVPSLNKRRFAKSIVAISSGSLATIGVLGTFVGIFYGLLDFDESRITASVPPLLSGLKIAFATSIAGIGAAVIFRFIRAAAPTADTVEGVTPSDIHAALVDIRDSIREVSGVSKEQLAAVEDMRNDAREAAKSSAEQIADLRAAISSDGESSLLTQIQKLRTTTQDNHKELIDAFRGFAQHMAENNQKAVIEALREVIRDFNQNLSEQFGENFKELNSAVHLLVDWQNNYREHIEQIERRLRAATDAIEATRDSMKQVAESTERIPEAIMPLEAVLTGLDGKTRLLNEHLESIAELRDKAIETFPTIESNLVKLTTDLSASVEKTLQRSSEVMNDAQSKHDELTKSYISILEGIDTSRKEFSSQLDKILVEVADKTSDTVKNFLSEHADRFDQQFERFDGEIQSELSRVLGVLGKSLASINEKFIQDYEELGNLLDHLRHLDRRLGSHREV